MNSDQIHSYDIVVSFNRGRPTAEIVRLLAEKWPIDFSVAWQTLDQVSRLILLQTVRATIAPLGRPQFPAATAMLNLVTDPQVQLAFSKTKMGGEINVKRCFRDLEQQIGMLDLNAARAAWAGLAYARDPATSDEERLLDRWLDPYHLNAA